MAGQREPPWTDNEKTFLLTEILKAASIHPLVLVNLINTHNIGVPWFDMPLPQGRSLSSCQAIYHDLQQRNMQPTGFGREQSVIHTPLSAPIPSLKRPLQPEGSASAGRALQPKPGPSFPSPYNAPSPVEPAPKKKRGRPTKAEAQARAEAAGHREEPPPPPPRPERGGLAYVLQETPEMRAGPSTVGGAQMEHGAAASALMASTMPPTSGSASESSSGKRRRARPARLELEPRAVQGATAAGPAYESPYTTFATGPHETPAADPTASTPAPPPPTPELQREPQQQQQQQQQRTPQPPSSDPPSQPPAPAPTLDPT